MKHLKMLGLAAIAAMGLMAFVGAGTASATTLFTDAAHTIPYPAGTTIHATLKPGTTASLTKTNGEAIATCTESTVHGTTNEETNAGALNGTIGAVTWGGCNQTTDTINTGSLSVNSSGAVSGSGSNVTLQVFGVSCTYGTGEGTALGTLSSGETPELAINAVVNKTAGSFLCPGSGKWVATYIVTAPHALYVGA